jgi:hypothetical protein
MRSGLPTRASPGSGPGRTFQVAGWGRATDPHPMVADMDTAEALKHLQTLINVASKTDDPDVSYKILREMIGVINNVEPPKGPAPPPKHPHLRSVK